MATAEKVGYFSVRKFPEKLRDKLRTVAARKTIREARSVSMEEVHAEAVEKGLATLEIELREARKRA